MLIQLGLNRSTDSLPFPFAPPGGTPTPDTFKFSNEIKKLRKMKLVIHVRKRTVWIGDESVETARMVATSYVERMYRE